MVFNLYIFYETRRYLARVIVFKTIYEHREELFGIQDEDLYSYPDHEKIILAHSQDIDFAELTDWVGANFRWMVEMNPSINIEMGRGASNRFSATLPAGARNIRIPAGSREALIEFLKGNTSAARRTWYGRTKTINLYDGGLLYNAILQYRVSLRQISGWIRDIYFLNQDNSGIEGYPDIYVIEAGTQLVIPDY